MKSLEPYLAPLRFGFGAPLGAKVEPIPWLLEQLKPAVALPRALRSLSSSEELIREYVRAPITRTEEDRKERRELYRDIYIREMDARLKAQRSSDAPFRERLVAFWSNHFTVSITKPELRPLVGAFEREAIRPYVTGSFRDMLLAVTQHPTMLIYLDNSRSIGPNSVAGRGSRRGLNENHARELLELHTLGVDGGYGQGDVEALARILTGWGVGNQGYSYDSRRHEPGEVELLGYRYPDLGERRGIAALTDLSQHPSTARFIATKLCRHFLADEPSPAAVERIATVFSETDGDLALVSSALVHEPEAWEAFHKYKTPYELVLSALVAVPQVEAEALKTLRYLGHSPFTAPSPAGWSDKQADWLTPEAVGARLDWAQTLGESYQSRVNTQKMADEAFGPLLSSSTRAAMKQSTNPLGLLLASPEFQWR
jgi:uncharacterized protein (DUF1800 family)